MMAIKLTADGLRKIFPRAPQGIINELVRNQGYLAKAGILADRQRLAYCFANVEHETDGFTIRNLTENINYTAARAAEIWPSRFHSAADVVAKFGSSPGWQLKMFDSVYGNRMGNRPGTSDGSRYIGRGACQHTGREGYAEMEMRTGLPLVDDPDLASKPEHQAALIAAFWSWKGMNTPADSGDFTAVVKRWNGGAIGMADRKARMAGNDLPIKELPRIEDATAELPNKPPIKDSVIVATGTVATATVAAGAGADLWIVAAIVVAAVVGFIVWKRSHDHN